MSNGTKAAVPFNIQFLTLTNLSHPYCMYFNHQSITLNEGSLIKRQQCRCVVVHTWCIALPSPVPVGPVALLQAEEAPPPCEGLQDSSITENITLASASASPSGWAWFGLSLPGKGPASAASGLLYPPTAVAAGSSPPGRR